MQVTYTPHHYDNDETAVDSLSFKAYEPVEVDERRGDIVNKFRANPFFAVGALTKEQEERKEVWRLVRRAQELMREHAAKARRFEDDPVGEVTRAEKIESAAAATPGQEVH